MTDEEFEKLSPNEQAIAAAHDYREQRQARAERVDKPNSIMAFLLEDMKKKGMLSAQLLDQSLKVQMAGWAGTQGLEAEEFRRAFCELGQGPTKYDAAGFFFLVKTLAEEIEITAVADNYALRAGVSYGLDYTDGQSVSTSLVPGYLDSSLMLIEAGFFDFCHVTAKLLALTFPVSEHQGRLAIDFTAGGVAMSLKEDHELFRDWLVFVTGLGVPSGQRFSAALDEQRVGTYLYILRSMEAFAIAHEYGHHFKVHSLQGEASVDGPPQSQRYEHEFEADLVATRISMKLPSARENPFGHYAIGGVILLAIRNIVCRGKSFVTTGQEAATDPEHPPTSERIDAIFSEVSNLLASHELPVARLMFANIIETLELLQNTFLNSSLELWEMRQR